MGAGTLTLEELRFKCGYGAAGQFSAVSPLFGALLSEGVSEDWHGKWAFDFRDMEIEECGVPTRVQIHRFG